MRWLWVILLMGCAIGDPTSDDPIIASVSIVCSLVLTIVVIWVIFK